MWAFRVTEELVGSAGRHSDALTLQGPLLSKHNLFIPRAVTDVTELYRQLARGKVNVPSPAESPLAACSAVCVAGVPRRAPLGNVMVLCKSLFSPPAQKAQRPLAKRNPSLPEQLCVGPSAVGPT